MRCEEAEELIEAMAEGEEAPGLADHLAACPRCRRALARATALSQALRTRAAPEPGPGRSRLLLTGIEAEAARGRFHRRIGLAAAGLLLVATAAFMLRSETPKPAVTPPVVQIPASINTGREARWLAPAPETEILCAPGSRLERQGEGWVLLKGSCLAFVQGGTATLSAGPLSATVSDGEVLLRVLPPPTVSLFPEALAGEPASVEAAVLSGRAELRLGETRMILTAGEILRGDGVRQALSPEELAKRREALFPPAAGEARLLDGRRDQAAWTQEAPDACYQMALVLRVLERPSALGLSFTVEGQPSFWNLKEDVLLDGRRHTLRVIVSPHWVTLMADGVLRHRSPREGFRPNPQAGLSGVGPVVWGGRADISDFDLRPWR